MSKPRIVNLWSDEHPCSVETLGVLPRLEIYAPKGPTERPRAVMIVCPGGAYTHRAYHEGEPVAQLLAKNGIVGAVLQYRVAPHEFPAPLFDACQSVRVIRAMADELNIDPDRVGMMGFSAGGHLAAMTAVKPDLTRLDNDALAAAYSARPDRLVLCYAPTSFEQDYLDDHDKKTPMPAKARAMLSPLNGVNTDTPPTFIWHTADDRRVPVRNSIDFAGACVAHGVPVETHIYPHGEHGLGLAQDNPVICTWSDLLLNWLEDWK